MLVVDQMLPELMRCLRRQMANDRGIDPPPLCGGLHGPLVGMGNVAFCILFLSLLAMISFSMLLMQF